MTPAHHTVASEPRPRHGLAYVLVIVAIAAGAILGWASPHLGVALKPLGDAFVKLIKMMIGPVIFLTVSSGIAGMKDLREVRGVAIKALLYFFFFSTLALIIGLSVANVIHPGVGMNVSPASLNTAPLAGYISKAHSVTIVGFLTDIIPETPISAFNDGNILQILFFAVLFGISLVMAGRRGEVVLDVLNSANAVVFKVVGIIMKAAPLGAFGAMAFTIGKYGVASLVHLAGLVACFYITSALFVVVVLGAVGKVSGFSIFRLLSYLREELLIVLGTSSSEAALPSLMQKLEALGCEKGIVGLVVPTGYSFNLDGTNIYMTLAALFIAQATGVHLNAQQQIVLLLVAMLSSKGAAGVTGAGFITLAATLAVVPSVPVAGMALILGVDRFMSECRAITNVIGNGVATIVVSRWEGALDTQRFASVLGGRGRKIDRSTPTVESHAPAGLTI